MLYIQASEDLRKKLVDILNTKNKLKLRLVKQYGTKNIKRWLCGARAIPSNFLEDVIKENIWSFLDGEYVKTLARGSSIKLSKKLSVAEALLLGWVLSEGHLGKTKTTISQANKTTLINLKRNLRTFNNNAIRIYPDRDTYVLRLPAAFKYYLAKRHNIPTGNKSRIITVPKEILNARREIKLAFLAAYFEGDGSFTHYKRKLQTGLFHAPRATIGTASQALANDLKILFQSLGYSPKLSYDKKKADFKVQILKFQEFANLFFDLAPYLICRKSTDRFVRLLAQERLLKAIPISAPKLVKKVRSRFKTWAQVSKYISKHFNYLITYHSVKNWAYGNFSPPLHVILRLCEHLSEDYFNWIPKYYAGLLWANKKISFANFKRIRGVNFINTRKLA